MDWTDNRPLDEIPFAQDFKLSPEERADRQEQVRRAFRAASVKIGQDIVELGCTGLVLALLDKGFADPGGLTAFVRENMTGSGIGLPCYVGPDKFCRVHNTIGGLQRQQKQLHPEGVQYVSRELTPEEAKHAAGIQTLLDAETAAELKRRMGDDIEVVPPKKEESSPLTTPTTAPAAFIHMLHTLPDKFVCPEHVGKEPVWKCRFCLAAAIINGPFEPTLLVETDLVSVGAGYEDERGRSDPLTFLAEVLRGENDSANDILELFVRVASWRRKLVRED